MITTQGINPDGSAVPLTARQKFMYSTPRQRLEAKIIDSRDKTERIAQDILGFSSAEDHLRNEYLIQNFVLGTI